MQAHIISMVSYSYIFIDVGIAHEHSSFSIVSLDGAYFCVAISFSSGSIVGSTARLCYKNEPDID